MLCPGYSDKAEDMRTIVKIVIWSLLVGLVLTWLGWTPGDLIRHGLDILRLLPEWLRDILEWAWPYIRQGAVIVVPVAIIMIIAARWRKRRDEGLR